MLLGNALWPLTGCYCENDNNETTLCLKPVVINSGVFTNKHLEEVTGLTIYLFSNALSRKLCDEVKGQSLILSHN